MSFLLFLMRSSRRGNILLVLLASLVAGLSNTGLLALINAALGRALQSRGVLVWEFIGLCLLMITSRLASEALLIKLTHRTILEMRMKLSRQILDAPLRHLEEIGAPRLTAALTEDVPVIAGVIFLIPLLCMNVAMVLGCIIYLGYLSRIVLLCLLVFMAFGIISYRLPLKLGMRHAGVVQEKRNILYRYFRALTDGMKELKLHSRRREAFLSEVLLPSSEEMHRQSRKMQFTFVLTSSWGQFLIFIFIGLVLFALPAMKEVSTQVLTGYTLASLFLMTPLEVILNAMPGLARANVTIRKVEELGLSLKTMMVEPASVEEPSPNWRTLELKGVTHSYHNEREGHNFILGPLDLSLHPREILFVIGGNGSGKTTLVKLLTGLYTPESGEIRLDGQPVSDENRDRYRQYFSVVFSDFHLFESLLGLDATALAPQVQEYLVQLQLDHKVQIKDGALSTTNLSQGQRKRLALLTSYLEDHPIYVFDEWAADQDPVFKEVFYYELLPRLKARGKTVIVISHDDRYYHVADRIIKLDYGKIMQQRQASDGASEQATEELEATAGV